MIPTSSHLCMCIFQLKESIHFHLWAHCLRVPLSLLQFPFGPWIKSKTGLLIKDLSFLSAMFRSLPLLLVCSLSAHLRAFSCPFKLRDPGSTPRTVDMDLIPENKNQNCTQKFCLAKPLLGHLKSTAFTYQYWLFLRKMLMSAFPKSYPRVSPQLRMCRSWTWTNQLLLPLEMSQGAGQWC